MASNYGRGRLVEYRIRNLHLGFGATFSQRFAGSHGLWDGVSAFPDGSNVWWQAKLNCQPTWSDMKAMTRFASHTPDYCLIYLAKSGTKKMTVLRYEYRKGFISLPGVKGTNQFPVAGPSGAKR